MTMYITMNRTKESKNKHIEVTHVSQGILTKGIKYIKKIFSIEIVLNKIRK